MKKENIFLSGKHKIRVLHIFKEYLRNSENWAFRLLENLPDTQIAIASQNFLRCNFYRGDFEYHEFPLKVVENPCRKPILKILNRIVRTLTDLYPFYLEKIKPGCDLIHSHYGPTGWKYRRLPLKLQVPHIVSFYGFDYECLPHSKPIWRKRYFELYERADLFICEGAHGKKILERNGCPDAKIRINRLGIDPCKYNYVERVKSKHELHLLQIANFVEKKGQQYAVEAFSIAAKDCPNMTLTFIGGERQGNRSKIMRLANNLNLGEKIFFLDPVDYQYIQDVLKKYQVLIHPSCHSADGDCEGGAPVILIDAQATGMPIISTLHCDIPEEVINGKTGFLTKEKDSNALAESIRLFYKMGQREFNGYAENANEHVKGKYDIKENAVQLESIYQNLLSDFRLRKT